MWSIWLLNVLEYRSMCDLYDCYILVLEWNWIIVVRTWIFYFTFDWKRNLICLLITNLIVSFYIYLCMLENYFNSLPCMCLYYELWWVYYRYIYLQVQEQHPKRNNFFYPPFVIICIYTYMMYMFKFIFWITISCSQFL